MTAGEDQTKAVIVDLVITGAFGFVIRDDEQLEFLFLVQRSLGPSDAIDRPIAGGREQPRTRAIGETITRPLLGRDGEGFLGNLLGKIEIAEGPDQSGDETAPLRSENLLERWFRIAQSRSYVACGYSCTGRTSMVP